MIDIEDLVTAFTSYTGAKANLETTFNNYEGCEFGYHHGNLYDRVESTRNNLEAVLNDYIDSRVLELMKKLNKSN